MYLERLNLEIQQCKDEQQKKEDRRHDLDKDNVQLQTEIKNLQEKELPKACEQIAEVEKRIDDAFDPNWIIKIAEPRYIEVKSEEREVSLKERFYRAMKQTEMCIRDRSGTGLAVRHDPAGYESAGTLRSDLC